MNYVEIIGYVASVLVAVSLTMSKILKLRVINLLGAVTFSLYGFLLGAYPIFFVNGFIVGINIYYLFKMYKNKDSFEIINASENIEYLEKFFNHYKIDINLFFPEFKFEDLQTNKAIFILRNLRPVNLVVYNEQENGIINILLDYTITEYRDFLNGKYLLKVFKNINDKSKNQLVAKSGSMEHSKYLTRLGFKQNDLGLYVIKI